MKLIKGKSRRTVIFTAITAVLILALLTVNIIASYLGGRTNFYVDLTPEGLYSLTDEMEKECAFIDELGKTDGDKCVRITFCSDPDYLVEADITRATYFMALELQKRFDNIKVETVNLLKNPTALSKYKTTSLTTFAANNIIVSYGERYRVASAPAFWVGDYEAYDGEYTMATLLKSVTAIEQPAAYFVTGHKETVYNPAEPESEESLKTAQLYSLLVAQGMSVSVIDLEEEDGVPEDCALLIINNPREDFRVSEMGVGSFGYNSELEKIEKYLINNQGALAVARDYDTRLDLTNLDAFLHSWGFSFSDSVVADTESSVKSVDTDLVTVYDTTDGSYAYEIYKDFASVATAPKVVAKNTGYITTCYDENEMSDEAGAEETRRRYLSFLKCASTANAYAYTESEGYGGRSVIDNKGAMDVAALTARERLDTVSAEYTFSFVFCAASADFFSSELLGNGSYANYDVTAALLNDISRVDVHASLALGGTSYNSESYLGKPLVSTELQAEDYDVYDFQNQTIAGRKSGIDAGTKVVYTVLFAAAPLAALSLGIYVCVRRRFK